MSMRVGVCCAMLLVFSGCASLAVKREVVDNIVHSSYPRLTVKIDPVFRYLGQVKHQGTVQSVEGEIKLGLEESAFIFLVSDKDKAQRVVNIVFSKIETYFISDFWKDVKNKLESGVDTHGGKTYQYYTRRTYPSSKGYVVKYIFDKGYTISCGLTKRIGRVEGGSGDILVYIRYLETLTNVGLPCSSWKHKEDLTARHQEYLQKFNERFLSSFEILPTQK